jgi:hypothetical protein
MKIRIMAPVLAAAMAFAVAAQADDKKPSAAGDRFEQFKQLAGEWVGTATGHGPDQKDVHVQFKVTAAGSAVVETEFPGTEHEMVTVITQDGDDLALTHYCMLGNQPRMKADPNSPPNQLRFKFAGGTNLNPAKDKHMHEGTITFVDDDHVEWSGVAWDGGKPCKGCGTMKLVRRK